MTAPVRTAGPDSLPDCMPLFLGRFVIPSLKLMPRISKGLRQAYELQDFVYSAAMSLKGSLPSEDGKLRITREDAQSISALVKSWEACQQRIQVHRRVPNPGSLRHGTSKPKGKPAWGSGRMPEPVSVRGQ